MKKFLTLILLSIGLQSFAQKNIDDLILISIDKHKDFNVMIAVSKIFGFTEPDSVSIDGKKYTMYFFDINTKTVAHEELYNNYIVVSKKMASLSSNYSPPQQQQTYYGSPQYNRESNRPNQGWGYRPRENDAEFQKLREEAIAKHRRNQAEIARVERELQKNETELRKNNEQIRKNIAEMAKIEIAMKKIDLEIQKNNIELKKVNAEILKAKNKKIASKK